MTITTRVNRMALACLTCPGHPGMEQLSLSHGNWMVGFGMDRQTLLSCTVGSGTLLWLFCLQFCIPWAFRML